MTRSCPVESTNWMHTLGRSLVSFGSLLVQTSHEHAITGTPADVPVPKNVNEKSLIVTGYTGCFDQWTDGQALK